MGNVTMEALSQLLELVKQSGVSVLLIGAAGLFFYKKGWPWWCEQQEKRAIAQEAKDKVFIETIAHMTTAHAQAMRDAANTNAAAVDRNTEALRGIDQTVKEISMPRQPLRRAT